MQGKLKISLIPNDAKPRVARLRREVASQTKVILGQ